MPPISPQRKVHLAGLILKDAQVHTIFSTSQSGLRLAITLLDPQQHQHTATDLADNLMILP